MGRKNGTLTEFCVVVKRKKITICAIEKEQSEVFKWSTLNVRLMTEIHGEGSYYRFDWENPPHICDINAVLGSDFRSLIVLLLIIVSTLKAAEITQSTACASPSGHKFRPQKQWKSQESDMPIIPTLESHTSIYVCIES